MLTVFLRKMLQMCFIITIRDAGSISNFATGFQKFHFCRRCNDFTVVWFYLKYEKLIVEQSTLAKLHDNYSVCSLVVPTLEEAILTSVLKKNFKWP